MKKCFLAVFCCILLLCACQKKPVLQTAETQSETSAAILSTTSNVITESSTFLETGETTTTVNWSVIVDPSPAAMAAFNIVLMSDPVLIRWKDIIEESLTNQVFTEYKDENGNWIPKYMDYIAVEIEVLECYIDDRPGTLDGDSNFPGYSVPYAMRFIWIPYSAIDLVTEGEQAIVIPEEFDIDAARVNWRYKGYPDGWYVFQAADIWHGEESTYPNIIPIVDGTLRLQKQEDQRWSLNIQDFFYYNGWLQIKQLDLPQFGDGMTLEDFSKMMEIVKEYGTR